MPQLLEFNVELVIEQSPDGEDEGSTGALTGVNTIFLDWTYTRSGRGYFRAGLDYTLLGSRLSDLDEERMEVGGPVSAEERFRHALYGGGEQTRIEMYGLHLGAGLRFGRRPALPWELGLLYRLAFINMGEGSIADRGLLYGNGVAAQLSRTFRLGEPAGEEPLPPTGARPFERGRRRAEQRWAPLPITIRMDGGGMVAIGPFLGAEWLLTDQLSLGVLARYSIWIDGDGVNGQTLNVLFPGITGRFYLSPQRSSGKLRGVYFGGSFEYHDYSRGADALLLIEGVDEGTTEVEYQRTRGSLVFLMAETGYRLPLWRSSFFEIGVQTGWALGRGRSEEILRTAADGTILAVEETAGGAIDPGPRISPVLAFGTRVY